MVIEISRKEQPLRWRNLTLNERRAITNGCGGKGGWFKPPKYCFTASCDHHDFNYWLGGDKTVRKESDEQFYEAMKLDASLASWWKRWWLYGAAWRYYTAVRLFGKKFFHEGRERIWEDLEDALEKSDLLRLFDQRLP